MHTHNKQKPVTSAQLAHRLQLSRATVSFVLNGKAEECRIPPATAERVQREAERLHYRPNSVARQLAGKRSNAVGVLINTEAMADARIIQRMEVLAAERGIRLQENKREHIPGGTGATMRIIAHTAAGDSAVTGTVLHGTSPRLMRYDGIDVEAELAETLIVVRNNDVPGVIGHIGTILGEARLNIANFALGRKPAEGGKPGMQAVAVIQIDGLEAGSRTALAEALTQLRAVEAISSVRVVELGRL